MPGDLLQYFLAGVLELQLAEELSTLAQSIRPRERLVFAILLQEQEGYKLTIRPLAQLAPMHESWIFV